MKRLCPIHGVYTGKSCDRCKSNASMVYDKTARDPELVKFYKSPAWRKVRRIALRRDPICKICRRNTSTVVDHIIEIKDGGSRLSLDNLQGLCAACHNTKTIEERMKREGRG